MKRRYAILAPDHFANDAKTAHGVIAYGTDETAVVIDPENAGKRVTDAVPYLRSEAPIVASVSEALRYEPTALLIGTAPRGGALPPAWRAEILAAIAAKLEIVSGLHDMLGEDQEFRLAAQRAGKRATFVPTGQTGIMIAGWGISVDRVIADFAPGATESLVLYAAQSNPDLIVVEGQGAINHPAYAPVTLALMYGAAPDTLVLVCDPTRERIGGYETPTLGYRELIGLHEALLATVKPARVVGLALNTRYLDDAAARAQIERARSETGIPADDVVRNGPDALYAAIAPDMRKGQPCVA